MYKRIIIVCLHLLIGFSAEAQRQVVVLDLDTEVPIKDVSIRGGTGKAVLTDYQGRATIEYSTDSVMFSHIKYEREKFAMTEIQDTMYLLPLEHQLGEVKVWGSRILNKMIDDIRRDAALYAYHGGGTVVHYFDFANLIDKRRRRDMKHLKKAKEILKDWQDAPIYRPKK